MGKLKPWTSLDEMRSRRLVCLGLLAATALPMAPVGDWSSSSSSSSSSGSSSSSSSSGSSADWEEFMARCAWNSTATQFGFASIIGAAEPYSRKQIAYKVGPERFSFARLQRDYGTGDASCKATWRFHLRDLRRLHAAMHFPDVIETGHEQVPGEEAFLIMLRRLAYPATWATLAWPAGRSPYALSRIFNATIQYTYDAFEHLRDSRSLEAWSPHFHRFAAAIHRGGRRSRHARWQPMPLKNCVGFIDGSIQYTDKPGIYESVLYNGHKRAHLVKWQGIMFPNGIMPMPFGPINGRRNDAFMLHQSGVIPALRRACRRAGRTYQLYGDPAYPLSPWLSAPFQDPGLLTAAEARFNEDMSSARVAVEWGFGKIKVNWAYLDFKKGMKPYQCDIQKFWPVAQILTNCEPHLPLRQPDE